MKAPTLRRLAGCALAGLAACSEGDRPVSILLVTLDTTRADRLGCYGRREAGTPVLDALAERGVRFEQARAVAPITLPSHASLLTGSYPPHHGLRDNGLAALDAEVDTLAEACARAGRRTAAFVSGFPVAQIFGLAQGFERYDDELGTPAPLAAGEIRERRGDATVRAALEWLAGLARGESFFLWVHLFDPHEPYRAPPEFAARFSDDPYQAEIAFTDEVLGRLLAALERLGRTGATVVAVTADHGEALGEHGEESHAILLYEGTLRVPLFLAGPGVRAGGVVRAPVSLVDLPATLVELAGIDDGGVFSRHGGTTLVPLFREQAAAPERVLYFETCFPRLHYGWSELFGIVRGEWKYVEAPGAVDAEGRQRAELFAPASDPLERTNLAASRPELVRELAAVLRERRTRLEERAARSVPRRQGQGDLDALAALGYGGVDVLERPASAGVSVPGPDPREVVEAVKLLSAVRYLSGAARPEQAEAFLERLAALDPGGVVLHEARGEYHLARGRAGSPSDLELAAAEFRAASELKPGRRGLWVRRSEVLGLLGRWEEALECVDRALELAPANPEFLEARAELERRVHSDG